MFKQLEFIKFKEVTRFEDKSFSSAFSPEGTLKENKTWKKEDWGRRNQITVIFLTTLKMVKVDPEQVKCSMLLHE